MTDDEPPGPFDGPRADFLRLVSHELRTPLTGIRGYTDLLGSERTGVLNDVQRQMLGMIGFCVHRLDSLVEDLLVLASIDAGLFGLVLEPVALGPLCTRVTERYGARCAPGRVVLRAEHDDGLPVIEADPRQLERLLVDLLDHAVRYTPDGCTVLVRMVPAGDGVSICVATDGTHAPYDDPSLGLTVVRAIAHHHGGTVAVYPDHAVQPGRHERGRNAVTVVLPVRPPANGRTVARAERSKERQMHS
jgi:signal transduction histidine kinase